MILQEIADGLLLFRQTDHALLSGAFAAAWGNATIPPPARRESTLIAAARHDDGWAEWELAPRLGKDGEPVDFIHIPVREHVELYRRGIDLVESEDPFAGLIASLHGQRLYTRPFYPGMDPRIEHLEGPDLEMATAYVEGERVRQERLTQVVADPQLADHAEEGWRLLQVWDRLSLFVCMSTIKQGTDQKLPPIASTNGDVQIVAHGTNDGRMICDPYPFTDDPMEFVIEAFHTPQRTWENERRYRQDFRTADRVLVTFRCSAG